MFPTTHDHWDAALFWGLVGVFAAFGAMGQLLAEGWLAGEGWKNLGRVMTAMFAAWVMGLLLQEFVGDKRRTILGLTGLAAWGGRSVLSNYQRILDRFLPSPKPVAKEEHAP